MRKLILLVGPTCTGKSTLEAALNKQGLPSLVSYTTRARRVGEIQGIHYDFLTKEQVLDMEARGEVIQKVDFAGNYYGTTTTTLAKAYEKSNVAVAVVEPTGVTQFKEYAYKVGDLHVIAVYINNTIETLTRRLVNRFDADVGADPKYYWQRLQGLVEQHDKWLHTHYWDIYIHMLDDAHAVANTDRAINMILVSSGA